MNRVSVIMAFEHVSEISLNYDENACELKSKCYQKVLRFHIRLKGMLSNSICLGLMKNKDENAAVLISAVFLTGEAFDSK